MINKLFAIVLFSIFSGTVQATDTYIYMDLDYEKTKLSESIIKSFEDDKIFVISSKEAFFAFQKETIDTFSFTQKRAENGQETIVGKTITTGTCTNLEEFSDNIPQETQFCSINPISYPTYTSGSTGYGIKLKDLALVLSSLK